MKKTISLIITICMLIVLAPVTEVNAASGLNASAGKTSVSLSWKKLSKKQQKKVKGIAVFRNGKCIKRLKKNKASYTDKGLTQGCQYTYQIKSYTTKKKKKKTVYKYKAVTNAAKITTKKESARVTSQPTKVPTQPSIRTGITLTAENRYLYGRLYVELRWVYSDEPWDVAYSVFKDGVKIADVDINSNGYLMSDEDVDYSTSYTYTVKDNHGVVSNAVTVTTQDAPPVYVPPTVEDGDWIDVSDAYTILNEFRMNPENQWYYDQNEKKVYLTGMYELQRDPILEEAAKERAKEKWKEFYQDGFGLSHSGIIYGKYENLAEIHTKTELPTSKDAILGFTEDRIGFNGIYKYEFSGWAETNCSYSGQGHRRIMLAMGEKATKVGIACYAVGTSTMWVMQIW